jgi:hypothetical protein
MTAEDERQARLAAALRANLKRRKAAGRPAPASDAPEPAPAPPERPEGG